MSCKMNEDLMDAYLDGELDLVRSLEIEQHVKECMACSQAYERRRSFVTAIKTAPLSYRPPEGLEGDVRMALRRAAGEAASPAPIPPPRTWDWNAWLFGAASAAALAAALVITVPRLYRPSIESRLSQDVVESHVRSLMANHLTDVGTSNQHVVKPWFNGRLDFSPVVRDFSDHGFPLAGGRLDYVGGRAVAAIVYHRAAHPINLFVWPSKGDGTVKEVQYFRQGYNLIRWSGSGMTYWAVSDLNEHELKDFVELLQKQPST